MKNGTNPQKSNEVFPVLDEFSDIREEWKEFYKTHFDWDVDFSFVIISKKPKKGNWRLLFIAKSMNHNLAFKICKKLFKSWKVYDDLDNNISKNIRSADSHYVVWVRDEIEPDKNLLGKSIKEVDSDMNGITLLERIIFEIKYFTETDKHLDIKYITFCSGSRDLDGNIPRAYWYYKKFSVDWDDLSDSYSIYGIRLVVYH